MHSLRGVLNRDISAWRRKLDHEQFDSAIDADGHKANDMDADMKDLMERNKEFRKSQSNWNFQQKVTKVNEEP